MCSALEGLLLKKKLTNIGDSHEIRSQKIDKLKILSDSLASSTIKAEKRISDNRQQKEQAFNFRLSKANEVSEVEKELEAEVAQLEKKRNDIEAELKRVNASLTAVLARLHNAREEKEQFDEANNQIIEHLMKKDVDLSKSVVASTVEADVVRTWINFLEDTWILQSSYTEQKERSTNDELEKSVKYFVKLVTKYLGGYKEELEHAIIHIRKCTDTLNKFSDRLAGSSGDDAETRDTILQRKKLEGEYLDAEAKILITFSVVDNIKELYYSQHGSPVRQNNSEVREAFDSLERLRQEYESLLRPPLVSDDESPKEKLSSYTEGQSQNLSHANQPEIEVHPPKKDSLVAATVEAGILDGVDPEAELAKLESEFGKADIDHSTDEIEGWDFDELEQELNCAETSAGK